MRENDYGDAIPAWKVQLIVRRARRLGFREGELEDVQQEIILPVLAFCYDPARSNGASEETALVAVIDNQLKSLRRKWRRRQEPEALPDDFDAAAPREGCDDLAIDVRDGLAGLPDRERRACEILLAGGTYQDVRREMCCNGRSLKALLARAREGLRAAGLCPDGQTDLAEDSSWK